MKTIMEVTANANEGFKNFALSYSKSKNLKWGIDAASYSLDTMEDVNDFEKMLALFVAGKYSPTIDAMNADCTWAQKIVQYEA